MSGCCKYSTGYDDRSIAVLETALARVDAYKSWRPFDPGREHSVAERYAAMPVLTKKDIRSHFPQGLLPSERSVEAGLASGKITFVETSGTLGNRVPNIWNQEWWDGSEKASWKLNAYADRVATGNHPEAILASALNVGFKSDDVDLPIERRRLARFLYLNEKTDPGLWSPALMDRMIDELGVFRPAVLEANPSFLAKLCRYIAGKGKKVFQPGLIVLTYECPATHHYRQIRRVFDVPVASSYGATEVGYVLMECEAGKLHQNSEFCRVDFQPLKPEHGGPFLGRILVTTFNNPWFYIVRFDAGDLVRLDETGICSCGRNSGMIFSAVEGRAANATLTCSGRLVTFRELDEALSVLTGIDEYQLEQYARDVFRLHVVGNRRNQIKFDREAGEILKNIYGRRAKISVAHDRSIPIEVSGKYSMAKTFSPIDVEQYLDEGAARHGGISDGGN